MESPLLTFAFYLFTFDLTAAITAAGLASAVG